MSKIDLDPITSGYNLSKINANFQKVEDELNNKVLYRNPPAGEPNSMSSNLDMNSRSILNASKISSNVLELGGVQVVPINLAIDPYNGTREALRRSYAEAGYNLVDGSFEAGGTLVNANDVLLHEATGKAFSGPAGTVAAGTNPASGGFVDRSGALNNALAAKSFASVQAMLAYPGHVVGNRYNTGSTDWIVKSIGIGIAVTGGVVCPVGGYLYLDDAGVKFDGTTDNKVAIDYAASLNIPVKLQAGYAGTTGVHVFSAAIAGAGSKICGFLNLDTSAQKGFLITVNAVSDWCYGFSVDGSASTTANTKNQDPASWSSSNYDTWYGTAGIVFNNCPGIQLSDVVGKNTAKGAGVRLFMSDDAVLTNCHAKRSRGNFGDGFYANGCKGTKYIWCSSWDTTRIGFVSEGNATTSKISSDITYIGCSARYAHDASKYYGGAENACGFWAENTADLTCIGCSANDVKDIGFVYAPTSAPVVAQVVTVAVYEGCRVDKSLVGFDTHNVAVSLTHKVTYTDCSAVNIEQRGFVSHAYLTGRFDVTYNSCHAGLLGVDLNSIAFATETVSTGSLDIYLNDCSSAWANIAKLSDQATNSADVSQFSGSGKANIFVNDFVNITTGETYVKHRQTSANYNYYLAGGVFNIYAVSGGAVKISRATAYGMLTAQRLDFSGSAIKPSAQLIFSNGEIYGDVTLKNALLYISHALGSAPEGKKVMGKLDVVVEQDIPINDFALRIQCEQTVKPTFIVNGTFYNTGAAAAAGQNFIWVVRSGTNVLTTGAIKDDTVPNMYRVNTTPGNFAVGQQNVTMH